MAAVKHQDRDISILRTLFECRVMTSRHIGDLHFEGRPDATRKRLLKLKKAGLIAERKGTASEHSILFLSRKAFTLLKERGVLSEYPPISISSLEKRAQVSDLTIQHELEVMDVKASLTSATRNHAFLSIAEFSTWPALNQFEASRPESSMPAVIKPDGFLRIHEKEPNGDNSEHTFFLELDRSTEVQDTLALKCACYMDYYRTGGFALRNGADRSAYKEFPFRVLIVLKNAERRNNAGLRMVKLNPPILTQVWFTTFDEITTAPLGSIWMRPVDCQSAIAGTRFEKQLQSSQYIRQSEREAFIENVVKKLPLIRQ
jgi:hypothetical protein